MEWTRSRTRWWSLLMTKEEVRLSSSGMMSLACTSSSADAASSALKNAPDSEEEVGERLALAEALSGAGERERGGEGEGQGSEGESPNLSKKERRDAEDLRLCFLSLGAEGG